MVAEMLALADIVPGVPTSLISCHRLKHWTNQSLTFDLLTNLMPDPLNYDMTFEF